MSPGPCAGSLLLAACLLFAATGARAQWKPLANDRVHDPRSPAIGVLQEPAQSLSKLPPDTAGNYVKWIEALDKGVITPRTSIKPETELKLREDSIVISKNRSMAAVTFPHRPHTLWLDCSNCHEKLFVSKAGANKFSMQKILEGEQCGLCHGAVAFPLTECNRCHNTSDAALRARQADAKR